jgi:hypothetical protein
VDWESFEQTQGWNRLRAAMLRAHDSAALACINAKSFEEKEYWRGTLETYKAAFNLPATLAQAEAAEAERRALLQSESEEEVREEERFAPWQVPE